MPIVDFSQLVVLRLFSVYFSVLIMVIRYFSFISAPKFFSASSRRYINVHNE